MSILAGTQYDEQIRLEQDAIQAGKDRYWKNVSDATKRGDGCDLPVARIFTDAWMPTVTQAFAAFIEQCRSGEMFKGATYCVPVYYNADASECATIFLRTVFSLLLRGEVVAKSGRPAIRMDRLADTLGKNITAQVLQSQFGESWRDDELALRRKKEQMGEEWDWTADEDFQHLRILMTNRKLAYPKRVLQCVRKLELSPDMNLVPRAFMNVGAAAINVAMPMLVVMDGDTPYQAFVESRTRISSFTGRARRVMELTPEASRIIDEAHAARAVLRPIYEPMVMTPFAWVDAMEEGSSIVQGGYIKIRTPLVAKPHPIQKRMIREADMTKVFHGIDACASQPWMVNERILRIQQELLRTGEEIGSLPSLYPKTRPMRPDAAETNKKIHRAWKRSCIEWEVHRIGHLGVIQQVASTHAMCEKMLGRRFYLPHMLDFRGRCFPVPPMLNHHGDDARRSLMLMASDKPMTNDGRYWLMVHAANMYGVDDVPIAERAKWTEDNASNITRACSDPHGDEFWKRAAEPFQFLAACYGLMDDDVGRYIPCQRDGTMNGLQHYAAMARDADAAGAANLRPSVSKHKVYGDVLKAVHNQLQVYVPPEKPEDWPRNKKWEPATRDEIAEVSQFVTKAVVKQPVMTDMYGVTPYGVRKQVHENLVKEGCPKQLARRVRSAIAAMIINADVPYLRPAKEIKAAITAAAEVAFEQGKPFSWVTATGFPVLQHYSKSQTQCNTIVGKFNVLDRNTIVPKPKQISSSAPNTIHSFDACHLNAVAATSQENNLSFAGVFDSFWAQPADFRENGVVVLDEFVKFHEKQPLADVFDQWRRMYGDEVPDCPTQGDWDLSEVRSSQFAFS